MNSKLSTSASVAVGGMLLVAFLLVPGSLRSGDTSLMRPEQAATAQSSSAPYKSQIQQVIQFMRERKHAYETRDVAAWGRHVAEKCSLVEAGGRLSTKEQFSSMEGLVGYKLSVEVSDIRATEFGETILLTYREKDTRDFGMQRSIGRYLDTETYARVDGEWKLIAFTENLVATVPAIVKLDLRLYDNFVGTYAANKDAIFVVTREGDRLFGKYPGEEKAELLPASKSRFFVRGDTAAYLFVWDKSGKIVAHIYRAEGVEIRYDRKIQ
jgi:Domain of unknown function (DUF4440)